VSFFLLQNDISLIVTSTGHTQFAAAAAAAGAPQIADLRDTKRRIKK
jgi:hypothetical protein